MRHLLYFLPFFVFAIGCSDLPTDSSAGLDTPDFAKGGGKGPPGGGGGSADPAIAFTKNGDLMVMDEDGSHQTILGGTSDRPSLSPDGKSVAYIENWETLNRADIQLVGGVPQATNIQALVQHAGTPAWSPNGDLIVYPGLCDAAEPDGSCPPLGDGHMLMVVSAAGGDTTAVYEAPNCLSPGECQLLNPTWNTDGSRIAFVERRGENLAIPALRIVDLANTPTQASQALIEPGVFDDLRHPSWSRNGDRIVFYGQETNGSSPGLYIVYVSTGNWERLSGIGFAPTWSPDDTKLVIQDGGSLRLMGADPASSTYGQIIPKRKSKLGNGNLPDWRRCQTGDVGCGFSSP